MLVRAVARIDHVGLDALGQKVRRAGGAVANDDHVDTHGFEIPRRVHQRLPLRDARPRRGDAHRVGRETLFGELEGDAGAGGGFEEEVDDGRPAQGGHLLDGPLADLLERLRGVEHETDLVARELLEPEQVLPEPHRHSLPPFFRATTTASRSSTSVTSTSIRSFAPISTVLPTTSGWMGSSLPPRSMST